MNVSAGGRAGKIEPGGRHSNQQMHGKKSKRAPKQLNVNGVSQHVRECPGGEMSDGREQEMSSHFAIQARDEIFRVGSTGKYHCEPRIDGGDDAAFSGPRCLRLTCYLSADINRTRP